MIKSNNRINIEATNAIYRVELAREELMKYIRTHDIYEQSKILSRLLFDIDQIEESVNEIDKLIKEEES